MPTPALAAESLQRSSTLRTTTSGCDRGAPATHRIGRVFGNAGRQVAAFDQSSDSADTPHRPMLLDEDHDSATFNDVLLGDDDLYIAGMVNSAPTNAVMALVKLLGETVSGDGFEPL